MLRPIFPGSHSGGGGIIRVGVRMVRDKVRVRVKVRIRIRIKIRVKVSVRVRVGLGLGLGCAWWVIEVVCPRSR